MPAVGLIPVMLWLSLSDRYFCYQITMDQVMMSHSPLRMFKKYHDKCVLVSGQGPVLDIAKKYLFEIYVARHDQSICLA